MAKTLRVRTRAGWVTKPAADTPQNRLSAEEVDDNFLALDDGITGNAGTATALQTARTINGVTFNGTANITLPTVNLTAAQTIAGIKTFSDNVVFNGNVGIGTSSSGAKLDVSGAGFNGGRGRFASTDSGNGVDIVGVNGAGINDSAFLSFADQTNSAFIGLTGTAAGAGAMRFAIGGVERIRISAGGLLVGLGSFYCRFGISINANTNTEPGVLGSYASSATNAPDNSGILWNGMSGNTSANGYVGAEDGGQLWQNYTNDAFYTRKRWGGSYTAWRYIGG